MQKGRMVGSHKRQWVDFTPRLDVWNSGPLYNATSTIGQNTVTVSGAVTNVFIGQVYTGQGSFAGGTKVTNVVSATPTSTITLSNNATATGTGLAGFANVTPNLFGTLANGTEALGRYIHIPEMSLVRYDFILSWGLSGSGGAGYYLMELPVPARLQLGGITGLNGSTHADRFIGTGHVSQSLGKEYPNIPIHFMPGDYPGQTYGRRRQDWCQAFCPYVRVGGSASPSGVTTFTVTFPVALNAVPNAGDIQVGFTSTLGTKSWFVSAITTNGFTITFSAAFTGTFDWRLMSDNSLLIGSGAPFAMGGWGDTIKGTLCYEPDC
jgi:hypothetical protein